MEELSLDEIKKVQLYVLKQVTEFCDERGSITHYMEEHF